MSNFLRQLDILNPSELIYPVTILGVGGIGSPTALTLAKMGFQRMTLYDPGRVEAHNRPSQWFRACDEFDENDPERGGRLKVEAAAEIIGQFAEWCQVTAFPEPFEGQRPLEGIVICAVDHMEADETGAWGRQEIWEKVRYNVNVPLYLDGRLGGEIVQVYTVRPSQIEDVEDYQESLFCDGEAMALPCTEQAIVYTGLEVAVRMASHLKKWLKNESYNSAVTYAFKGDQILFS